MGISFLNGNVVVTTIPMHPIIHAQAIVRDEGAIEKVVGV
jgi:hypothetical protein